MLMLAVLAASCLMQFHHHDCLGEVRMALAEGTDLILGPTHHHHGACDGRHEHGHGHCHPCGLHLSKVVTSERRAALPQPVAEPQPMAVEPQAFLPSPPSSSIVTLVPAADVGSSSSVFRDARGLRAPPCA